MVYLLDKLVHKALALYPEATGLLHEFFPYFDQGGTQ